MPPVPHPVREGRVGIPRPPRRSMHKMQGPVVGRRRAVHAGPSHFYPVGSLRRSGTPLFDNIGDTGRTNRHPAHPTRIAAAAQPRLSIHRSLALSLRDGLSCPTSGGGGLRRGARARRPPRRRRDRHPVPARSLHHGPVPEIPSIRPVGLTGRAASPPLGIYRQGLPGQGHPLSPRGHHPRRQPERIHLRPLPRKCPLDLHVGPDPDIGRG